VGRARVAAVPRASAARRPRGRATERLIAVLPGRGQPPARPVRSAHRCCACRHRRRNRRRAPARTGDGKPGSACRPVQVRGANRSAGRARRAPPSWPMVSAPFRMKRDRPAARPVLLPVAARASRPAWPRGSVASPAPRKQPGWAAAAMPMRRPQGPNGDASDRHPGTKPATIRPAQRKT
jgi:hypothetical protein